MMPVRVSRIAYWSRWSQCNLRDFFNKRGIPSRKVSNLHLSVLKCACSGISLIFLSISHKKAKRKCVQK